MVEDVGTFTAPDGLVLRSRSWVPEGEQVGVVALLHGGVEHSGRYGHTAERLTAAGFQVDAFDQRSHGASERVRGVPFQIDRFDDLLDDTEAWLTARRRVHGERPLFVLAHSMGALISVTLAARGRLPADGLITTGAALAVRLNGDALAKAVEVATTTPDVVLSRLPRGGYEGSTRDEEMRRMALDDPLHDDVEGVPARFLAEIATITASVGDELHRVTTPLLVLHGSDDTMADVSGSEALVERAASSDKTLVVWPGGYHSLLRDVDRHEVESAILRWMQYRLPAR